MKKIYEYFGLVNFYKIGINIQIEKEKFFLNV
jgi:hypothetical protein